MEEYSILEQVKIRLEQFHIENENGEDKVVFDHKEENPLLNQLIKQAREDVVFPRGAVLHSLVSQSVPYLRYRWILNIKHDEHCQRHEHQRGSKEWVDVSDDLFYGQQCGNKIIDQDDDNPENEVADKVAEYDGRTVDEDGSHHHEKENGEHKHCHTHLASKVFANNLRQAYSALTHGDHTAKIVVDSSGKNASEDNPQETRCSELCAHDGSKDGTGASNV